MFLSRFLSSVATERKRVQHRADAPGRSKERNKRVDDDVKGFFFVVVERSPNRMNQTLIATMTESGGHTIESGTNKDCKTC